MSIQIKLSKVDSQYFLSIEFNSHEEKENGLRIWLNPFAIEWEVQLPTEFWCTGLWVKDST